MPKKTTITPFAAKGETLPGKPPSLPRVSGRFELCGTSPMFTQGAWFWTAYDGHRGFELECSANGTLPKVHRMECIDMGEDDE